MNANTINCPQSVFQISQTPRKGECQDKIKRQNMLEKRESETLAKTVKEEKEGRLKTKRL